jgi:hypothetical protein
VRMKLLGLAVVGALAIGGVSAVALRQLGERPQEVAALHALRAAARSFENTERGEAEKLLAAADALASNDDLRRAFVARDRDALQRLAEPVLADLRQRARITHWYFIAPDRTVFLRVHAPAKHGDQVDRVTLAVAARTGSPAAGKDLGRTAFALRVVQPYRDRTGGPIGFLELGEEIDHFLTRMKEQTGDDFALVVKKSALDEQAWRETMGRARDTWNDRRDTVVVNSTTYTHGLVDYPHELDAIPDGGVFLETMVEKGRALARGAFPVHDAAGQRVGALFVLHDFTDVYRAVEASQRRGIVVLLAIGALSLVALGVVSVRVSRRSPPT